MTKFRERLSSIFSLGMFFLLLIVVSVLFGQKNIVLAINNQITFQGKLTDPSGTAIADGTKYLKISIYDAASAGSILYTVSGTIGVPTTAPITTAGGVFSINLGDTDSGLNAISSNIFTSDNLYLGITVCTAAGSGCDAEMTPRKRLTSSPYAFNADYLGGVTTSTQGGNASYIPATDSSGNLKLSNSLFAATSTVGQIGFGTSTVPVGVKAYIESTTAADKLLVLRANATQSGNLTEWQNAGGTSLASIGIDGSISASSSIQTFGNLTTQGNLYLPVASPTAGLIYSGGSIVLNAFGTNSIFVGKNAGDTSLSGTDNTAVGTNSLTSLTTGSYNTSVGYYSLANNDTGSYNSAFGQFTLANNSSGYSNTAYGYNALELSITGNKNTALGDSAGLRNVSGSSNVFLGFQAGYNELGSNKLYIANTSTTPLIYGEFDNNYVHVFNNLGVGPTSTAGRGLFYVDATGSVSASSSISSYGSLHTQGNLYLPDVSPSGGLIYSGASTLVNASGTSNIFVGKNAGNLTFTSGAQNSALGNEALSNIVSGTENTAVGNNALFVLSTGGANTAVGSDALFNNNGSSNTAVGFSAMLSNLSGINNVAIGRLAGYYNTGSNNVFLGNLAGYNEIGSNKLYISNSDTYSPLIYGEFDNAYAHIFNNLGVGPTSTAAGRGVFYVDSSGNTATSGTLSIFGDLNRINNVAYTWPVSQGAASTYLKNDGTGGLSWATVASGVNDWAYSSTYGTSVLTTSSSYPVWLQSSLYASSTAIIDGNITTNGTLTLPAVSLIYSGTTPLIVASGTTNLFVGKSAGNLTFTATAANNTAFGDSTLTALTTGLKNSSYGYGSLNSITDGSNNVALGYNAMHNVQSGGGFGSSNIAIGDSSLSLASLSAVLVHSKNIAIGNSSGLNLSGDSSTNVFIGETAGQQANGNINVIIGSGAGIASIGSESVLIGDTAGQASTINSDVLIGYYAGYGRGSGSGNAVSIGNYAGDSLGSNTGLNQNVSIGDHAGAQMGNNSSENISIGDNAGLNLTGSRNIVLGYHSGQGITASDRLYVSNANTATPLIYGEFDNALLHVYNKLAVGPNTSSTVGVFYVDASGNVSNSGTLHVYGGSGPGVNSGLTISATAATTTLTSTLTDAAGSTGFVFNTSVAITSSTPADRALAVFQNNGVNKVVITASGTIYSRSGVYAASSEYGIGDVAENVNIVPGEQVDAGNVVVVDMSGNNQYKRSNEAYAKNVAGVISDTGQFVIGAAGANRAPLAIAGLVNVKVTSENGKISVGDYLVTASKAGYAMRYDPESGKSAGLVGMALEPLNDTEGSIKILVNKGLVAGLTASQNSNGQLVVGSNTDFSGGSLLNVNSIKGKNNKWQIDENGYLIVKVKTSVGDKQLYGLQTGMPQELVMSSSSQLENGSKQIIFDQIDQEIIDSNSPIKVTVTLTGDAKGVYVSEKNSQGFIVKELGSGTSNATFDWMVIAKRKTDVNVNEPAVETSSSKPDLTNDNPSDNVVNNTSSTVNVLKEVSSSTADIISETTSSNSAVSESPVKVETVTPAVQIEQDVAKVITQPAPVSESVANPVPVADLLSATPKVDVVSQ